MRALLLLLILAPVTGCGYHAVGAASHIPVNVHTIEVPVFATRVQAYHTEMAYTQAVVRELNLRTRYRVETNDSHHPDAVLRGTVLTQTVAPLTYDATSGMTSSYLISITARVVLTGSDGKVLYRNDAFRYQNQYQSTTDLSGFIQEDSSAVNRMARDFAQSLVSDMLESF